MSQPADTLHEDLAYMRRMTKAGRCGPPLGGLLLAAFGGYIGLAALLSWARAFEVVPLSTPLPSFTVGFIVFALVGLTTAEPSGMRLRVAFAASLVAAAAMMLLHAPVVAVALVNGRDPGALISFARYAPLIFVAAPLPMLGLAVWLILRLRRHAASEQGANRAAGAAWTAALAALAVIICLFFIAGLRAHNWFMMMALPGVFWAVWGVPWLVTGLAGGPRWSFAVAAGAWLLAIVYGATFELFMTSAMGLFALALLPGLAMVREAARAESAHTGSGRA
jgi:hypothetical protein